jgi:hypothetical protein
MTGSVGGRRVAVAAVPMINEYEQEVEEAAGCTW